MDKQHPDYLRSPELMCEPDFRNADRDKLCENGFEPYAINDHHQKIDALNLNPSVPEDISTQFETSKNIYLYAWCVYRFFPVARQHALSVLELALRERLESEIPNNSLYRRGKNKHLYLSGMLKYCRDHDIISDDDFEVARHKMWVRAATRYEMVMCEKMDREGLSEIELNESEIRIEEIDRDIDHVGTLVDILPKIRNSHAHGTTMLSNASFGTLRTVSEIINQLWDEQYGEAK